MMSAKVGRLFALGSNGCGQLGVGHDDDLSIPHSCFFASSASEDITHSTSYDELDNDCIKRIACGGNHTLVLTERGQIFASGNDEDGRCGVKLRNDKVTQFFPVKERPKGAITDIAAAWAASYFVEDDRKVFVLGFGEKGELGLGEGTTNVTIPKLAFDIADYVADKSTISQIVASMNHVVILLSNGELYGWGASRKGQLGEDVRTQKICWRPYRLPVHFQVQCAATGRDYTMLVGPQGDSLLLGESRHFSRKPILPKMSARSIQSGWSSILYLDHQVIAGYGRNDRGQLPPDNLENVIKFAAGSEHAIALTTGQSVVAWGWGEHGNCGMPLDERGNAVGKANKISIQLRSGEKVAGLGAGCATSFIWTFREFS